MEASIVHPIPTINSPFLVNNIKTWKIKEIDLVVATEKDKSVNHYYNKIEKDIVSYEHELGS